MLTSNDVMKTAFCHVALSRSMTDGITRIGNSDPMPACDLVSVSATLAGYFYETL